MLDGALFVIPHSAIQYDALGHVRSVQFTSAFSVFGEREMDNLVSGANVANGFGVQVTRIGDLDGLLYCFGAKEGGR